MSTPAGRRSPYGWQIGSLAGSPIYLGRSWPVIAVVIVVVFGPNLARPDRGPEYGYLAAAGYALLLLLSVLVHEAAHALAARWSGHPVDRIVADVWGGHTVYDSTRTSPGTTALIAVVGPLANLALAVVGFLLHSVTTNDTALLLLEIITFANLFVGLFNLLPGLPLDGGQIVSALVWRVTGRRGAGFVVAGWLGRVVAVATVAYFVLVPFLRGQPGDAFGMIFPIVIAAFLWQGATGAIRAGHIHEATAQPAAEVLEPVVVLPATTTVAQADAALASGALRPTPDRRGPDDRVWLVTSDDRGWPVGVVETGAAQAVPHEARPRTTLSSVTVAQPGAWVVGLSASDVLTDLIRVMSERSLSYAVVVDSTSRSVLGLATADRINAVVGAQLARRGRR
ncbi:site-2 protease family protein [Humibacillus xanthopallidus]|uniref:Zn-dependent protease n=1 Tax=Humibacillus xanthopallidus TaxID=412689 RepID=A0A543HII5_9MICO|nr:site-2 protease family protein [Humibacillus xanthopallidus]TQM58141.1 Zn-dependent protease [Humibacillus xanthopallidus]